MSRKILLLVILLSTVILQGVSQYGEDLSGQKWGGSGTLQWDDHIYEGHFAFGEYDYESALRHYQKAQMLLQQSSGYQQRPEWDDLWTWIELVKERQKLGKIQPVYTHRVRLVFLPRVDASLRSSNPRNQGLHCQSALTEEQKQRAVKFLQHQRSLLEALSGGKLSMDITLETLDAEVRELEETVFLESNGREIFTRQLVFSSMVNADGESFDWIDWLHPLLPRTDTFIWCWNGEGFATTANGGGFAYPLVPYQILAPLRGYLSMPVNWKGSVFPHEFFHVTEFITSLPFTHGHLSFNRHHYPAWKGQGEMDYQRWQFRNWVALQGWTNFNLVMRYPLEINVAHLRSVQALTEAISLKDREKAHLLGNQSMDLWFNKKQYERAYQLAGDSLALNPWNPGGLRVTLEYYIRRQDSAQTVEYINHLHRIEPAWWLLSLKIYHEVWKLSRYRQALDSISQAWSFARNSEQQAELLMYRGYAYKALAEHAEAQKAFSDVAALSTNQSRLASAYWEWGVSQHQNSGTYQKSLPLFKKSQELEATGWKLRHIAWIYYWQIEDLDQALALYQQALTLEDSPAERADCYRHIGRIYLKRKEFILSREALQNALKLAQAEADQADIYWVLGQSWQDDQENWGEALKYYLQSIQKEATGWKWRHIGWIQLWKINKPSSAILSYEKSLRLESDPQQIGSTWLWITRAYLSQSQYTQALQAVEKSLAVKDHPWYGEAMFWKGLILAEHLNRAGEGIEWITKGMNAGYDNDYSRFYWKKYNK